MILRNFNVDWMLDHASLHADGDVLLLVDVLLYFGRKEPDVTLIGVEGWREIISEPAPGFIPMLEDLYGIWNGHSNSQLKAPSVELAAPKKSKHGNSRLNWKSQPNRNKGHS